MSLNDYEETLKSFIHDEEKLVTYKWLSKQLEVHVNVAKDVLKQHWEKHKSKGKICATFLLIGQLQDGSIRVEVVKDADLITAKEKFIKIDCEHLYSLQKYLSDIELLASAGEADLQFSAIKCNEELVRNKEEIESLRYVGNVKKEVSKGNDASNKINQKPIPKSDSSLKEKSDLSNQKNNDKTGAKKEKASSQKPRKESQGRKESPPKKLDSAKSTNEIQEKKDSSQKKSDNSNFGNKSQEKKVSPQNKADDAKSENECQEKKTSPPNKSNSIKPNGKAAKKPVQSKQSGFNNLFGKVPSKSEPSNSKNEVPVAKEEISVKKEIKSKEKESMSKKVEDKKSKEEKENEEEMLEKVKNNIKSANDKKVGKSKPKIAKESRGTKRNRSQEKNATSKRKRIVIMDSSDEGSGKSDNEEIEEPMEIEEEPPKVVRKRSPSPPVEKRENGKRMIRKAVSKTYKDEEGYLVTKQVYIYEAVSENEESADVKKKEAEEAKKSKPVENKAKKQATLMNFFKKS